MAADVDREARIAATEAALLAAAEDAMITVTADGRISERAASRLLGFNDRYLADRRIAGVGPVGYDLQAGGSGRYSYRVAELAAWVESLREAADGRGNLQAGAVRDGDTDDARQ